jgi:(p)ppGpp synthase/HD superfamily hydrolase
MTQPRTIAAFTVEHAVEIARRAHEGQLDKSGKPYIGHPMRVMSRVSGPHAQMAAVLHDVIEDTPVTAGELLAAGCPPDVVSTVVALSRNKEQGESLPAYLARVAADPVALVVKRADIADNSGPERFDQLDPATQQRLRKKYSDSLRLLDEYERGGR